MKEKYYYLKLIQGIMLLTEDQVTEIEQKFLIAMAIHGNADGTRCYPGIKKLAKYVRRSERETRRILKSLKEKGFVMLVGRVGYIDMYDLQIPGATPISAAANVLNFGIREEQIETITGADLQEAFEREETQELPVAAVLAVASGQSGPIKAVVAQLSPALAAEAPGAAAPSRMVIQNNITSGQLNTEQGKIIEMSPVKPARGWRDWDDENYRAIRRDMKAAHLDHVRTDDAVSFFSQWGVTLADYREIQATSPYECGIAQDDPVFLQWIQWLRGYQEKMKDMDQQIANQSLSQACHRIGMNTDETKNLLKQYLGLSLEEVAPPTPTGEQRNYQQS